MAVNGILGKKVGMTQLFDNNGEVRPATVLQAGPCVITQRKTSAKDGYEAAQIGLVEFVKESRLTKGMKGHFGKHNLPPMKFLREVDVEVDGAQGAPADGDSSKAGDRVLVDIFDGEKFVDIIGTSKGHMGAERVTVRNLRVLGIDKDDNLLVVEGAVPGPNGGYVIINKAKKGPRERRGFAGSTTVDPLKASKRQAAKKK